MPRTRKQTKKSKNKGKRQTKGQKGGFKADRRYRKTPKNTTQRRKKKMIRR